MTQTNETLPPLVHGAYEVLRLRTLMSLASEWMWQTDENFQLTWMSRGALNRTGILSAHVMNKAFWDSAQLVPAFNENWSKLKNLMNDKQIIQDFVVCYVNSAESLVCLSLSGSPMYDENGKFLGYVGLALNLSDFQKQGRSVLRILNSDPLTGSANWKTMEESFDRSLLMARRKGKSLGFIVLRLPNVPTLMECYTFAETTKLMQAICLRMEHNVRKGDVIGRLAINEFGVLLNEIAQENDLLRILEKFRQSFAQPFSVCGKDIVLEVEFAQLTSPECGEELETLINVSRSLFDKDSASEEASAKRLKHA